jgi:hypothetical protein
MGSSMRSLKLALGFLLLFSFSGFAQQNGMVKWTFRNKKIAADTFEITAKAVIERDWHIYSQDTGEGSSPTVFTFAENQMVKLEGKVIEDGKLIKKRNEILDSEIKYYVDSVMFVQRVIVKRRPMKQVQGDGRGVKSVVLKGTVEFMVCNEQMCLPPEEVPFTVDLK